MFGVISGFCVSVPGLGIINCVSMSLLGTGVLLISGLLMLGHLVHPEVACDSVA